MAGESKPSAQGEEYHADGVMRCEASLEVQIAEQCTALSGIFPGQTTSVLRRHVSLTFGRWVHGTQLPCRAARLRWVGTWRFAYSGAEGKNRV